MEAIARLGVKTLGLRAAALLLAFASIACGIAAPAPREWIEGYWRALTSGQADHGWSYLASPDRERVFGGYASYEQLVGSVDWSQYEFRFVSGAWDDPGQYLAYVEVDGILPEEFECFIAGQMHLHLGPGDRGLHTVLECP